MERKQRYRDALVDGTANPWNKQKELEHKIKTKVKKNKARNVQRAVQKLRKPGEMQRGRAINAVLMENPYSVGQPMELDLAEFTK